MPKDAGRKPTILVVDDNDDIADFIVRTLQPHYNVLRTGDASGALRICSDFPDSIDLVLSDFNMPGRNGLELRETLKASHPQIRFLLMSGNPDDIPENESGPATVLRKPFSYAELRDAVDTALHH